MRRSIAPFLLLLASFVPASAHAAAAQDTFFNTSIPTRIDALIGFTPTTFGIHPRDIPVKPISVRQEGAPTSSSSATRRPRRGRTSGSTCAT